MPRPRPPFRGGYRGYSFYPQTQVIEIERSEPAFPWRVVAGTQIVFQSSAMNDAITFFKTANQKALGGVPLALQRWAGNGWVTEATRNAGQLADAPIETGIFAIGVVVLLAAWVTLS